MIITKEIYTLLKEHGFQVDCGNPLKISSSQTDDSVATGIIAEMLIDYLIIIQTKYKTNKKGNKK